MVSKIKIVYDKIRIFKFLSKSLVVWPMEILDQKLIMITRNQNTEEKYLYKMDD